MSDASLPGDSGRFDTELAAPFLESFINLCDDLAWGRPASEDALFALTREGAAAEPLVRLAEAFGMMAVKVEAREFHRTQLIEDLQHRNAELETARPGGPA